MKYIFNINKNKKTYEICLVPFSEKHLTREYVDWFHDPKVTQYNTHGLFPYTRRQQKTFLEEMENTNDKIVWAIEIKDMDEEKERIHRDHTHIGNCALQRIDYINRSAEFAIVIGNTQFWGLGICSAALSVVLHHAFIMLGLNRVWSGTAATNIGMQKAMEKNHMIQEGVFKEGVFLNGEFVDVLNYGILHKNYRGTAILNNFYF